MREEGSLETTHTTDLEARLAQLEERLDKLQAKEEIREVLYRYSRAVDRCDLDLLKSVYHPEATDVHGLTFSGSALDFAEFIVPALSRALTNRHAITNEQIELSGDKAFVESLWCSTHRLEVGQGELDIHAEGRYLDIFERRNSEWRILHRAVVNDKVWTRLVPAPLQAATAAGPHGLRATVGTSDDPVYLGLGIAELQPDPNPGRDPFAFVRDVYAAGAQKVDT